MKKTFFSVLLFVSALLAQTFVFAQVAHPVKTPAKTTAKTPAKASTGTTAKAAATAAADTAVKPMTNTRAAATPGTTPVTTVKATAPVTSQAIPLSAKPPVINPFKKGTWNFPLKQNVIGGIPGEYTGNVKTYSDKTLNAFIDPNYFFIDHFAVGVDLRTYLYQSKQVPGTDLDKDVNTQWNASLTLTYATQVTSFLNLYIRAGGGIGKSHSVLHFTNNNTYFTLSQYAATIGAPLLLPGDGSSFLTPYISYNHSTTKFPGNVVVDKTFTLGLHLETYLRSGQTIQSKTAAKVFNPYAKGNAFIDFGTKSGFSYGTRDQHQPGSSAGFGTIKTTDENLVGGVGYYFMDNLAAGLNINLDRNLQKTGSDYTSTTLVVEPVINYHPLQQGSLRYLFAQASYGIGQTKAGGSSNSIHQMAFKAGWDAFLSKNVSFTPKIGWQRISKTSDGLSKATAGFMAELGFRVWLKI